MRMECAKNVVGCDFFSEIFLWYGKKRIPLHPLSEIKQRKQDEIFENL